MKCTLVSEINRTRKRVPTLPECLRVLRDQPVPCINICDLCIGEELLDSRDSVEGYILRFGPSDEKRWPFVSETVRVTEWEVCHVVEGLAQYRERNTELKSLVLTTDEVGEKELANWKGLVNVSLGIFLE